MEKKIQDFIWMSKYAGMREDMVQAGGGNSSCKLDACNMVIKASGFQLADVTETSGYAIVNPNMIEEAFRQSVIKKDLTEIKSKKIINDAFISGGRPSIETFLHSCLGTYALHTHPVVVNVLTCLVDWKKILNELFPQAILVPYATPGVNLAKKYFTALQENNIKSEIIFLQNHGMIIGGDSAKDVIEKTEEVLKKIEKYLGVDYSAMRNASELFKYLPQFVIWAVNDINVLKAYEEKGIWDFAFCPDSVVFLGKDVCKVVDTTIDEVQNQIDNFIKENGQIGIIEYKKHLYLIADSVKKAYEMQSILSHCAQIELLRKEKLIHTLNKNEREFLVNWDVEKYRRNMK